MIGLGCGGLGEGGNSSSSTSNLSALAPPFTVDRLNPKPNSNPLLNYSESSYGVECFSHTWQYSNPSAPRPELDIHPTRTTSLPSSDDHRFSEPMSISPSPTHWTTFSTIARPPSGDKIDCSGEVKPYYHPYVPPNFSIVARTSGDTIDYGGEVKPYYPPYVPPLVGEDIPLIEDISPPIDYLQCIYDQDFGSRWTDSSEFGHRKQSKRVEHHRSFSPEMANVGGSHIYKSNVKEGCGIEFGNRSRENSDISYGKFNQISEREVPSGSLNVGFLEDKSCLEQNLSFLASHSTYPESQSLGLSHEMHKNFFNCQNSYSPYEECVGPIESSFASSVSVTRSSPTVVISPPPVAHYILGQSNVSQKPVHSGNVAGGHIVYYDRSNSAKQKDPGPKPSSEIKEGPFDKKISNFSKQGHDPTFLSSSPVKELSSPLHTDGTVDGKIKARFETHLPVIDVSGRLAIPCDSVQVNSVEDSSDFMDQHNPAVDSPCWKGAPSSQCSAFDAEASSSNHFKRNLDEIYGFSNEKHLNFLSLDDSTRTFSVETVQCNKNNESIYAQNSVVLPLKSTLHTCCQTKEPSLSDAAKAEVEVLTSGINEGVSNILKMPRKESGFADNLKSDFDMKISDINHFTSEEDVGMTLNDTSEGGAIAFHAAEKVLASPSSQEDATEHVKLQPDSKLDVQIMVKAMKNLSELLVYHISCDACIVEEENINTLEHIIGNLVACTSKKIIHPTNKQEPINPLGGISEKLAGTHSMDSVASKPYMSNEAANSDVPLDYQRIHDKERNHKFSVKNAEEAPVFSPLMDDIGTKIDDNSTKAIKKVLEENFHFNEEMQSQAFLFKSLWLEAEAKLCSISYKAHFDRVKIEMEKIQPKSPEVSENEDAVEIMSKVHISSDPNTVPKLTTKAQDVIIPKPTIQNSSTSIMSWHVDDTEASVMARLNILKAREDKSKSIIMEDEQPTVNINNDSAGNRFCIGHQPEDETLNVAALKPYFMPQTSRLNAGSNFDSYINDPAIHSLSNSRIVNQHYSGWHDTSSDWEHVLKDDFAWKKL